MNLRRQWKKLLQELLHGEWRGNHPGYSVWLGVTLCVLLVLIVISVLIQVF